MKTDDQAPVVPDEEVKAPPSTEKPVDVPAEKPDEPVAKAEDETAEAETEELEEPEEPVKKSKTSGYARLKARHERLLAQIEAERRQRETAEPEIKEPKVEDFNGDYLAFEKASVAFAAERAIEKALSKQAQQDAQAREAQSKQEVIEDFFERTEEVKSKVKDFDDAINGLYGNFGPLPNLVRDKIAEADNGPQILYYLAKNPAAARELYESTPIDALYQIGRLDEKMALPAARKLSKAPPPINPPKGGASPPTDVYGIATRSEDISDYVKARKAMKDKE
jgi:hypothetical protein